MYRVKREATAEAREPRSYIVDHMVVDEHKINLRCTAIKEDEEDRDTS